MVENYPSAKPTKPIDPIWIGIGYGSAVIFPQIGFFLGLYLILRKEHIHGAVCMAISLLMLIVWWLLPD